MWTKLDIEDESTYPPPYKRLLFCSVMPEKTCRGFDMYQNERPFTIRREKYALYSGVFLPDYRSRKYPDMADLPILRLLDDYERDYTYSVEYWQLAPEPPIEVGDTFEEVFRRVNEEC